MRGFEHWHVIDAPDNKRCHCCGVEIPNGQHLCGFCVYHPENNSKWWVDALKHLTEVFMDLQYIKRQSEGMERVLAEVLSEDLQEPRSRLWQFVRENCSLEDIADRNL
jgi:hypothetical protein